MKKILAFVAVALLGALALCPVQELLANKTTIGFPGNAGRPQADTISNSRIEGYYDRGIEDCSTPKGFSTVLSYTSQVFNVSTTASLGYAANGYAGLYVVKLTNFSNTDALVFVDQTSTALTLTQTAGDRVPAGQTYSMNVQQTDGACVHVFGLTATVSTINYTVCNY